MRGPGGQLNGVRPPAPIDFHRPTINSSQLSGFSLIIHVGVGANVPFMEIKLRKLS